MNLNAVEILFIFLQWSIIGLTAAWQIRKRPDREASCKHVGLEGEPCFHPQFSFNLAFKNNYPVCYIVSKTYKPNGLFPGPANFLDKQFCAPFLNNHTFPRGAELQTDEELRHPGQLYLRNVYRLLPNKNEDYAIWVNPLRRRKTENGTEVCRVLSPAGYSRRNCSESNYAVCEMSVRTAQPPVQSVFANGLPEKNNLKLFEGQPVRLRCSGLRERPRYVGLILQHVNGSEWYITHSALAASHTYTDCGVKTVAQTMWIPFYRIRNVICHIGTTVGVAAFDSQALCYGKESNVSRTAVCSRPFTYYPKPGKPEISVKFQKPPNVVSGQGPIQATCTYDENPLSAISWAAAVDDELHFLKPGDPNGTEITETRDGRAWISKLTQNTEHLVRASKDLVLVCYIGEIEEDQTDCSEKYFWCNTILVHIDFRNNTNGKNSTSEINLYWMLSSLSLLTALSTLTTLVMYMYMSRKKAKTKRAAEAMQRTEK